MTEITLSSVKQGGAPRSKHQTWVIAEWPDAVITYTPPGTPEWFYRFGHTATRWNVISVYPLGVGWNAHFSHEGSLDTLRHVYINITAPPVYVQGESLFYVDQHLDVWVNADGTFEILDEDEFAEAIAEGLYTPDEAAAARATLDALLPDIEARTGLYGRLLSELPELRKIALNGNTNHD